MNSFFGAATTANVAVSANPAVTPESLSLVVEKFKELKALADAENRKRMESCKIAQYMRENGCPPEAGYILFLSEKSAKAAGVKKELLPNYCRVSPLIDSPVFVHQPLSPLTEALALSDENIHSLFGSTYGARFGIDGK